MGIILVCNLASKNVLVIFTSNINPVLTQLGVFLKWRVKPHLEESVIRKFNKLVFFIWIGFISSVSNHGKCSNKMTFSRWEFSYKQFSVAHIET